MTKKSYEMKISTTDALILSDRLRVEVEEARDHGIQIVKTHSLDGKKSISLVIIPTSAEYSELDRRCNEMINKCKKKKNEVERSRYVMERVDNKEN